MPFISHKDNTEEVRMKFKKIWIGCVISIVLFPITMVFPSDTGCITNNTPYTIQLYNWQIVHQDNPDAGIIYFIDFYVNGSNYAPSGAFTITMGPQETRCFQIYTGGGAGQGIQGDVYVFPQTIPGAGGMPVTLTKNYPVRMELRVSVSFAIATTSANIFFKFPAIVISSTGNCISPLSIQKPDAPRE